MARRCDACGEGKLAPFADIGDVPVFCGVHWASSAAAAASPAGRMVLAVCPRCAYVRNVAFDPSLLVYDTTMDTNLHHSPAFRSFSASLVSHLGSRYALAGKRVLDIGCGQGEFLRELCASTGATGVGYDAMYAGPVGPVDGGVEFHSGHAPRGGGLPAFDVFTSRHWFEHLDDPYEFLVDLRSAVPPGRPAFGYIEVPDACYDLATAGWEVIYPHVSYFDASSLCRIVERAGWRVEDTGTWFSGMFRYIEVSSSVAGERTGSGALPGAAERDRQLEAVDGFAARHFAERKRWYDRLGALERPVLWGAGSRGVQFLTFADPGPDQRLAAVVDVNPRKWGRYLPITAHRVDPPSMLTALDPDAVIITNPAYREEIGSALAELGVRAELLVA